MRTGPPIAGPVRRLHSPHADDDILLLDALLGQPLGAGVGRCGTGSRGRYLRGSLGSRPNTRLPEAVINVRRVVVSERHLGDRVRMQG